MTKLSADDVRRIAKLCRLNLSPDEVEKFRTDLSSILEYVGMLQEVNTKGVEPTAHVTGMENCFREDVLLEKISDPAALLATSPLPIVGNQIQTPSAHG